MLLTRSQQNPEALIRGLFANGEQGGWWDPSDLSSMFQDSAGTTPVIAAGDPVGMIRDKSGRGNHRTQATAASRPTLTQDASGFYYLNYDGVDDSMATAAIDFTATDKMTLVVGINKTSDAANGHFVELSADASVNNGAFSLYAPVVGTNSYRWISKGTVGATAATGAAAFPAGTGNVVTGLGDISGDSAILRVNGTVVATAATDQGTGNFGNFALFFGRRNNTANPLNGREYQTIIRGAASTAAQIAQAERFVGARMGIAL